MENFHKNIFCRFDDEFSTFPFKIFSKEWADVPLRSKFKGGTVIGNYVWIGYGAVIMPGIKIGDGAIIATCSVVTADVEPYTIVGGNPAKPIRKRFSDDVVQFLWQLKWWDWSIEKITNHASAIACGNLAALTSLT